MCICSSVTLNQRFLGESWHQHGCSSPTITLSDQASVGKIVLVPDSLDGRVVCMYVWHLRTLTFCPQTKAPHESVGAGGMESESHTSPAIDIHVHMEAAAAVIRYSWLLTALTREPWGRQPYSPTILNLLMS